MKKENRKNQGITLISLVVTIIILLILAGITIYLTLGNNGILDKAKEAKEITNKQNATEKINLKIIEAQMNKYSKQQGTLTLKELSEVLKEDSEIEYVTEKTQIASTKYEVGENPSSIFTKLIEYPYEFEINSLLQLASIDGIKNENNQDTNVETGGNVVNVKNVQCIYENFHKTDSNKTITYNSTVDGPVLVIVTGGSRNKNQVITLNCSSSSGEVELVNSYACNWGNTDNRGWTCSRTSIYFIPNISVGDKITATGAAYTGFPVFYIQIIQLGSN